MFVNNNKISQFYIPRYVQTASGNSFSGLFTNFHWSFNKKTKNEQKNLQCDTRKFQVDNWLMRLVKNS